MSKIKIDKDFDKNLTDFVIDKAVEQALKMECPNCGKKDLTLKKHRVYCPNCDEFIPVTIKIK